MALGLHYLLVEGQKVLKLTTILENIRAQHRGATTEDIRKLFGDYHNLLCWLAGFMTGDNKVAEACIVDACGIAETQTPQFHDWLVHWAARATVCCALQWQHETIAELALKYEANKPVRLKPPPVSSEHLVFLVRNIGNVHACLDVLSRFVLVLHGIAKEPYDKVATQLGISVSAVEGAYYVAFDTLELARQAVASSSGFSSLWKRRRNADLWKA